MGSFATGAIITGISNSRLVAGGFAKQKPLLVRIRGGSELKRLPEVGEMSEDAFYERRPARGWPFGNGDTNGYE